MANFVCENCRYRFEREKEIKVCPYCGEKGTIVREKTAGELIDNAGEE